MAPIFVSKSVAELTGFFDVTVVKPSSSLIVGICPENLLPRFRRASVILKVWRFLVTLDVSLGIGA